MNALGKLELTAGSAIERYLAEVTARLPGSARTHAALAAVREFGDPALVATEFLAEIAASQSRRAAIAMLATGPLVGLLWIAVASASHLHIDVVPPLHLTSLSPGIRMTVQLIAVAIGVTALSALLGIAVTGRLTRWLPASPRRAPTAAAIAGFGAIGADGLALVLLAAQLAIAPGKLAPLLAGAAAVASLARMDLARRAATRCLAIRGSLT